jgi:hypothetical protein
LVPELLTVGRSLPCARPPYARGVVASRRCFPVAMPFGAEMLSVTTRVARSHPTRP